MSIKAYRREIPAPSFGKRHKSVRLSPEATEALLAELEERQRQRLSRKFDKPRD